MSVYIFGDSNPKSTYSLDNNPIDGDNNSIAKNISSELMRIFKNDSLPDLLLEKIVASATDTSWKLSYA